MTMIQAIFHNKARDGGYANGGHQDRGDEQMAFP
jgi:hypothetical protein